MEMGLLHGFLGIFPYQTKDIIFAWRGAHEVRLKQTLEMEGGQGKIETNIGKLRKLKFPFPSGQLWGGGEGYPIQSCTGGYPLS